MRAPDSGARTAVLSGVRSPGRADRSGAEPRNWLQVSGGGVVRRCARVKFLRHFVMQRSGFIEAAFLGFSSSGWLGGTVVDPFGAQTT